MKPLLRSVVDAYLAGHRGVISRDQAIALGMTTAQVDWHLASGRWLVVYRGVYLSADQPAGPEARLTAACLVAGPSAAASHRSAGWWWGLLRAAPSRPSVTVALGRNMRGLDIEVHRRRDLDLNRIVIHRGIPVTDPLRTLADLGQVVSARKLDDAIDRALAGRLLTVEALEAEVDRLARQGRRGVRPLRAALERRGLVQAPSASVLESRVLRLLRRWGITPAGVEVAVCAGRYRIDVMLLPGLALEVDGYAFHWSPEAKAADSHRRNQLALAGIRVIEVDWVTVMRDPMRFRQTVEAAVAAHRAGPGAAEGRVEVPPASSRPAS